MIYEWLPSRNNRRKFLLSHKGGVHCILQESTVYQAVREESKKAVRLINLAKGHYAKNPTEELKAQILANYAKVINPTEKMTNDLKELGLI